MHKSQSYLNWMLLSEGTMRIKLPKMNWSQSYLNWMLLSELYIMPLIFPLWRRSPTLTGCSSRRTFCMTKYSMIFMSQSYLNWMLLSEAFNL